MNYHIGTMLIEENFDDNYECPLCRIHKTISARWIFAARCVIIIRK